MFINKNKSNYEFLEYLKELEKNEDIKLEQERKNRFKKLNIGTKMNHNIISTIKRRPSKKRKKKYQLKIYQSWKKNWNTI